MLNRRHRFHGHGSVRRVYANSLSVRGSLIGLKYAPRPGGKPYRVTVIVAKKVHKSAVKRNRIRRRIYEVVRKSDFQLGSTDLILTVFNEQVADMPAPELEEQVNNLLKKIAPNT